MSDALVKFKVLYRGATPSHMRRRLVASKRGAFAKAGHYWHRNFREKHFTKAGAREYGYEPRKGEPGSRWLFKGRYVSRFKGSYTARKLRQYQHTLPMVFSGQSEQLTRQRDVRATATQKKSKVRVVLHSPSLNRKNPHSNIDMRDEVTRVSGGEENKLTGVIETELMRKLSRIRDKSTKTIS